MAIDFGHKFDQSVQEKLVKAAEETPQKERTSEQQALLYASEGAIKLKGRIEELEATLERISNVLGEYGCPLEDPTLNALLEEIDAVLLGG